MTGIEYTKKGNGEVLVKLAFPQLPSKKGLSFYIDGMLDGPKLSDITVELWQMAGGNNTSDQRIAWFDQQHYFDAVQEWVKAGLEFHFLRCTIMTTDELIFRIDLMYPSLQWKTWEPDPDNTNKRIIAFKKDQGV